MLKPRVLELDFIHSDPLARAVPVPALSDDAATVNLKRVMVGKTETGRPWLLRLLGSQLLVVWCAWRGQAGGQVRRPESR